MMILLLVHKLNETVSNELLTHESCIDPENGFHQFVSSIYSSVPSILTSVILSCGDEFGNVSDALGADDFILTWESFISLKYDVSDNFWSSAHCQMSVWDNLVVNISHMLSNDHDHSTSSEKLGIISIVVHDSEAGCKSVCPSMSDIIIGNFHSSHDESWLVSSTNKDFHETNHDTWTSCATTLVKHVWHSMTIIDNTLRHVWYILTQCDTK